MSFDKSLLLVVSKENPYVDLKGDLPTIDGLPTGPLESSSRVKGRSSWLFSSLFFEPGLLGIANPSVVLRGLLSLHIPEQYLYIQHVELMN